jgi:5-methylcytosine-specific restriction protein A
MKLMNFRRFDPAIREKGGVGLRKGNHLEAEIWERYEGKREQLNSIVDTIRGALSSGKLAYSNVFSEYEEAVEGQVLTRLHRFYERDTKLARRKKQDALKKFGKLICEACEFDFARAYGRRGEGFIECHHRVPLHALHAATNTQAADLALLCANCHRIIHNRRPWLSVEELISNVRKYAGS